MVVMNGTDRFHLAKAVVDRIGSLQAERAAFAGFVDTKLAEHDAYIRENGEDLPEIRDWTWQR
jgi:xylulose-5-phosphate/fructose-6-phosphate phosphoketolase